MPQDPAKSSDYNDIPPIPLGLIDALERRFPSKCPDISDSERVIFLYAGKVELIRWMRNVMTRRQKDSLSPTNFKENITNV